MSEGVIEDNDAYPFVIRLTTNMTNDILNPFATHPPVPNAIKVMSIQSACSVIIFINPGDALLSGLSQTAIEVSMIDFP